MKIPPQAKLVFKGVIFDVYQWEQKMFDGTTTTFERLKRPDTVVVIATEDDKVLVIEEEQPESSKHLSLLGGRVDVGEQPLAAAQRELAEEAGLTSSDWEALATYEPVSKIDWTLHYFIARACTGSGRQQLDGGERITVLEKTFDEFTNLVASGAFKDGEFQSDILRMQAQGKLPELRAKFFGKTQ